MIYENIEEYNVDKAAPRVCIIGSGPAGISLALELEKYEIPCLIIEAGDMQYSQKSQEAYRGKVIGDDYVPLESARLRYLGGTSGHWAGWCRPLDDIDFEARAGVRNSGWPIRKKDLDPHAKATESILEISSFPPNKPVDKNLQEIYFRFSPPVRFGKKYARHLKESSLISVLINSPVTELVPRGNKISHVNIHSKNSSNNKILAKYFCLCSGGIENSRILLWSNLLHNGAVIPHSQTLGKYWMEHPTFDVGENLIYNFSEMYQQESSWARFYAPTPAFLRTHAIDNFGLRLSITNHRTKALIKDMICFAPNLLSKLTKSANSIDICSTQLQLAWGQVPVNSNRIELSDEKDALGIPRVNLFWKKQAQDRATAETAVNLLGSYLSKQDLGRVRVDPWLANQLEYPKNDPNRIGFHHMGGTRMASTPLEGIVDKNCKVFDMGNLFIGGSSVFATAGHTNPTYTIVQLALRLGEHIATLETQ